MKLVAESSGCAAGRYYYEVCLEYLTDDGRKIVGIGGFDGGLLGTEAFDKAKAQARERAEQDAREQV